MVKFSILILMLVLSGCGVQRGLVEKTEKGAEWEVKGKGMTEVEFYKDGSIKKVKQDNKAKPIIDLRGMNPEVEND